MLATHLRQNFKYFNRLMRLLWRLGLGGWVNSWPQDPGDLAWIWPVAPLLLLLLMIAPKAQTRDIEQGEKP